MPSKVLRFKTLLYALSQNVTLSSILLIPPCVFGCVAFVHLHKRTKFKLCVVRYVFLGYDINKKGFCYYNPLKKWLYTIMDVTVLGS